MNERIKQLKHQASLWCDINVPEQFSEYGYGEVWEDKFAELIVRECMTVCESATQEGQPLHLVSLGYSQRLKEHFGVEE